MGGASENKSVEFFDAQFRRQVQAHDYKLNPFESRALDHIAGTVLDLGCGLGNLALEAARLGHHVVAVDSSPAAIARIEAAADEEALPVRAVEGDLTRWEIDRDYTTIVAIGLLMFFRRDRALELLRDIQGHVEPGGRAIVNVLVEGTTYMEMFQPNGYYLFGRDELEEHFAGWRILSSVHETFPAPGDTRKEFSTVIAEKVLGLSAR
jgi:tellurite methyltransferase